MAAAAILDFQVIEFGHSGVLIVWHLCSVPNWVKIYAMVTLLPVSTFGHYVICTWPYYILPANLLQISPPNLELLAFSAIQDGGRRHFKFSS